MQGKAMGLDVGTKTIGVAVSDALGLTVRPVMTLSRKGVRKDCAVLAQLARQEQIQHLVVGLPLELDDTEARPARLARQIGEALGALLELPPIYIDERYSSVDAEDLLLEYDLSRARRKAVIDQAAAVLILESWMEHGDWSQIR